MRLPFVLLAIALLVGCGATPQAAAPVVETVVVTQVVTVEVTRVVTATPLPATPTPAATATPAETATPTPPPIGGKWDVTNDSSSFDGSATVILSLKADRDVEGQFERYRPALVLRCQEKQVEAYVDVGLIPDVEAGNLDGATVRIRIDDGEAQTLNTGRSTDDKALFFEDAGALIDQLAAGERLLFGFTPFRSSPVETTFDLRGLGDVLPQLQEACA